MPDVLVLLGSKSDAAVAEKLANTLKDFGVSCKVTVASAHRSPDRVVELVRSTDAKVLVGIAGVSAALPGVIAAHTTKPVIGVPVSGTVNLDALLSVVQMPTGVPVAAVGLDNGTNAALLAVRILALADAKLAKRLEQFTQEKAAGVLKDAREVEDKLK